MLVTLAQINPTIGDFRGNLQKIQTVLQKAGADGAHLLVLPELFLTGYPPRDLLERQWFIDQTQAAIQEVVALSGRYPEVGIVLGAPQPNPQPTGKGLFNSALLIHAGKVLFQQNKSLLPTYDVFDEARYFEPASTIATVPFGGEVLGITICEDAWTDPHQWLRMPYRSDPIAELADAGATLLINISASPYWLGKVLSRYELICGHAQRHHLPFIFVNQVGANDELVFDGTSLCANAEGELTALLPSFAEQVITLDLASAPALQPNQPAAPLDELQAALTLGVQDYARKSGFKQAVLGLSGGIDSALTAVLAVRALGAENVLGVAMPSRYSSEGSVADARALADNLGIRLLVIPIESPYQAALELLTPHFAGKPADTTEENLQSRLRGNVLMALSNKFGYLVLTTGNKSELAVGYCTLYGDMSGGLAVIADLPKTLVYQLANHINRHGEVIPQASITKAPSAELRPNQTDQDSLPPYEVLDGILLRYVDEGLSPAQIVAAGYDRTTVDWVVRTVNRNEYKRWQAAPGLKVTSKAFGTGRRMPLAARYSP
jgi:NAD+ synthase (glutamine-hydrolysing)